jgi:hypothetical protein
MATVTSFNGTLGRVTTDGVVILPSTTIDNINVRVLAVTGLGTPTAAGSAVTRAYAQGLATAGTIDGPGGAAGPRGPWGAAPADIAIPTAMLTFPGTVTFTGATVTNGVASYYRIGNMVRFFYLGDFTASVGGGQQRGTVTAVITPTTAIRANRVMMAKVDVNPVAGGTVLQSAATLLASANAPINVVMQISVGTVGTLSGRVAMAIEWYST